MPDDITPIDKGYLTIDNLGPEKSLLYAESLKQNDDSLVKLRNLSKIAEVSTTNIRPAELNTALNIAEPQGWVIFTKPQKYDSHNRRIFSKDGLVPGLKIDEQTTEKLNNIAALSKEETNQKNKLLGFAKVFEHYNKMNAEIYGRCNEFHKG